MGRLRSFLTGAFIGGLVGAAIGVLLSPTSGEETRALIADKALELRTRAEERAAEYYSQSELDEYEFVEVEETAEAEATGDEDTEGDPLDL